MLEFIRQPWPWYVAGPLLGLTVPILLLIGNKAFGISSSLRHICAACLPGKVSFFNYEWKRDIWNLFFVAGILAGGLLTLLFFQNPDPIKINPALVASMEKYGINNFNGTVPADLFSWTSLFTIRGFLLMVGGGFLVGFGTRYAGGCTSGHSIFGLSTLQWPSLVATCCFMIGGFIMSNLILPYILAL
jgi:uncharacterized protein